MATDGRPRILLTGADGQLGWELRRCFATLGEVLTTVGPESPFASRGERVLDLSDHAGIRNLMSEVKPDLVLNAAAYTAVDRAEDEVELATAINGVAPGILAREAARHGALLVHYSTDYVFDGESDAGYAPSDLPAPANAYGRTKLQGEEAIRAIGQRHFILRTSWLYGTRGNNFLRTMLNLIDAERPLRIVNDQIGAPTWARSVAEATAQIFVQAQVSPAAWWEQFCGTYHLTAAGRCSWFEFAQRILSLYRPGEEYVPGLVPIPSSDYPTKAERPAYSVLDCSSLRDAFGIALEDWSESLERVMEDIGAAIQRPPQGKP